MIVPMKYGVADVIQGIPLIEAGTPDYKASPTLASGDVKISKDGGTLANLNTLPVVTPASSADVKIILSDVEIQCKQAVITFIDQTSPKEWEDNRIIIHTFGHADAQQAFDLSVDSGSEILAMQDTLDVLLRTILESTIMTATTILSLASQVSFTLAAGSTDDDAYNDCMIVCKSVSTPARKAIGLISDYTGSSKTVSLVADPGVFTLAVGDEVFVMSVPKNIADIKKLLRADKIIDTAKTPWVVDYKEEGTSTKLLSKTMQNTAGANITTENNVLGQLEQE